MYRDVRDLLFSKKNIGVAIQTSDPEVGKVDVLPLVVHDQLRPAGQVGRVRNVGEGLVVERRAELVDEQLLDRLDADDCLRRINTVKYRI